MRLTLETRASGVLLHPTSLPGRVGVGELGPAAHKFVDFLAAAAQSWWQMLPIGPPSESNSPSYHIHVCDLPDADQPGAAGRRRPPQAFGAQAPATIQPRSRSIRAREVLSRATAALGFQNGFRW